MRITRDPEAVHAPLAAYHHQIELRGEQRLLALSGQVGVDRGGNFPDDPIEQLNLAWENVVANLGAADMTPENMVRLTIYLVGDMDAEKRRAALARMLGPVRPCMTVLYVVALGDPALKVELDVWASSDQPSSID